MQASSQAIVKLAAIGGILMATILLQSRGESDATLPLKLRPPRLSGEISVEEALNRRRSVREFANNPLTLAEVTQLLWAAQGITSPGGYRTAPSAGALYPLTVYLLAGEVDGLAEGLYRYLPATHALEQVLNGDYRPALASAALGQDWVKAGAAVIVISGDYSITARRYGERASRYVHIEAGHAAQNIYLQADALNLGTVIVGAFIDKTVSETLTLPDRQIPLCIMPVGRLK